MRPQFLNIDLELITRKEPTKLIQDFGDDITIMHSDPVDGRHLTICEVAGFFATELSVLQEYKRVFKTLSPAGQDEWNQAIKREFNFGYETERAEDRIELSLPEEALSLLSTLGGSFGVTVYNNEK